jgi:hypothetical protein
MARTAVTVTTLTANTGVTEPAGTTADPTNDHVVSGVPLEELVIRLANTNGSDRVATIKAGDNPPAIAAGLGDLAITVPATSGVVWVGPLSSARFAQSDGTLEIDLATSFAGTVTAYRIPRTA